MPIVELPIIGGYDVQSFKQFNPEDCANWYLVESTNGKKKIAMYPAMGRRHIEYLGSNELIFAGTPRGEFKSINYSYYVVGSSIFRVGTDFSRIEITSGQVVTLSGNIFFDYIVAGTITFAVFVDGQKIYVYREDTGIFSVVTDANAPLSPTYIKTYGNRLAVAGANSSQFSLSKINLDGGSYSASTCFTPAIFAQESGMIRQFAVLQNTLYIFTDFTTGIWSNIPSPLTSEGSAGVFPWKKNTSYEWDYGIVDPLSLDTDFNMMVWLARNKNGLFQVMMSNGQSPVEISTRAINILFQRDAVNDVLSPFMLGNANGFLYEYEDTIFYRLSAGTYINEGILDQDKNGSSIEYNFEMKSWERCIELNGERNRIEKHLYFGNRHLVTVQGDNTVYEMSGQFYDNEITNPLQTDREAPDAYIRQPFRYERVTPIMSEDDYSESIDDYVEIDFVWGEQSFIKSENPFANTQFLIDEVAGENGELVYLITDDSDPDEPTFIIADEGNTPQPNELTYNNLFKPHIELYFSDDGGVSFLPADVREFSQLGYYQWRMRWYELGTSRNRCYKLVCVSSAPIIVLGGVVNRRRASGGAN